MRRDIGHFICAAGVQPFFLCSLGHRIAIEIEQFERETKNAPGGWIRIEYCGQLRVATKTRCFELCETVGVPAPSEAPTVLESFGPGGAEAALGTAYEVITGKTLTDINFVALRGMDGIKEAEVDLNGMKLKVAVAHTLGNARKLMEQIERGESPYAFIEVMTCPGGCLGGGGQLIPTTWEIRKKRAESIYAEDLGKTIRKSHENPQIVTLYKESLKAPL